MQLWRDDGPDFSERDRLLLQLLRPHLYEVHLDAQRRRNAVPSLSRREVEDRTGVRSRRLAVALVMPDLSAADPRWPDPGAVTKYA